MEKEKINIIPYNIAFQVQIDALMLCISKEFSEPISLTKLPDTSSAAPNTTLAPDVYLLATLKNEVIGTISVTKLKEGNAVLRKMFLHKDCRGKGIAKMLLNEVLNWAVENNIKAIYLGTMTQFVVAQKFYEKNGFNNVSSNHLPEDFPINPVDAIFYQKKLI